MKAGWDMPPETKAARQPDGLTFLGFMRHPACLSLDGVLAQPVGEVLTGMVDLALVGRPRSGFDDEITAEIPQTA
jgi:hypothetical protein